MDIETITKIYHTPLLELLSKSHKIHCAHHDVCEIQLCSLISFKTGGCSENCAYCPQSSHYKTDVAPQPLLQKAEMLEKAKCALSYGITRICIGAAWRSPKEGHAFNIILDTIAEISAMGIEVCCTLGMLTEKQASDLKKAGIYAYNHNLDTSSDYYKKIISTRTYQDRLDTLNIVDKTHISLCSGAIIGMGEKEEDRIKLLHTLVSRGQPPESFPINFLIPIKGTPLENTPPLPTWEMLRMIATARIVMPKTMIRLAAGRLNLNLEQQALCFFAGANSIFSGEKLLTRPTYSFSEDEKMFQILGLKKKAPFKGPHVSHRNVS